MTEFVHPLLARPLSDRDPEEKWLALELVTQIQNWTLDTWPPAEKEYDGRSVMHDEGSTARKAWGKKW